MVLLDLLGRRWALRIVWELREERRLTFRELLTACDASPSVLNTRLAELREAGFIAHAENAGYGLTEQGQELLTQFASLHGWAEKWAKRTAE